ncbi:Rv3654c family TadE-like protein [Glaciibacter psychrotolerans]|uniref:Secretion/DNA translocation related TadE-like protein n=1 Tax=Glaciibacter psychrotolerans TaxID=670054 RepID=A0A7Z0J6D0_9MICO|nr:Rv3654c family TadE-like protein [Leifsonia psychrotolerans]NYJ20392.1 secretion/DNA translocation related TadE-like protein [Leifsonia psychrotolerans]
MRRARKSRRDRSVEGEGGSGSLLAVGVLGATLALTVAVIPLYAVLAVTQQVQGAAAAAALAAADTASGLLPGIPCSVAARVATANGASIDSCAMDGLIASVVVSRGYLGFTLEGRARAGPPPSPQ